MPPVTVKALAALLLSTLIFIIPTIYRKAINNIKLRSIPTVGCSGLLTSYFGARRFVKDAKAIVQEGYDKYRGSIFKVSTMRQWMIVVSGPDKLHDISHASDEYLSLAEASNDDLHLDVSFGSGVFEDPIHIEVVRNPLTRNIGARFNDVREEILAAFEDNIPVKNNEWLKVGAYSTMLEIVCRAGNRMLVDLPLCRNPEYLNISKKVAHDIMDASNTLNKFPPFLKSIVSRFTDVVRTVQDGMEHIGPFVLKRLEQEKTYGKDWADRPDYPLRKEIEEIIQREGWSKASIGKMNKLDSFIKESMRLIPLSVFGVTRKVMKDFTFSDGTTIPAGNTLAVPALCMNTDPDVYPDPETFDGFRFDKMREKAGENNKHQFVSIELDYMLFGQGRHACPGRFFAANELKTLLAHVLLNYDIKLAGSGGRPQPFWIGAMVLVNPIAELLFRKRV